LPWTPIEVSSIEYEYKYKCRPCTWYATFCIAHNIGLDSWKSRNSCNRRTKRNEDLNDHLRWWQLSWNL
jgi:hypothetical protein